MPSGYIDLDRITAGFQPSDLVIIAARPSVGKTALALNIAAYASMDAEPKGGVAFFSLEMSKEQLVLRLLCSEARVDSSKARAGYLERPRFPASWSRPRPPVRGADFYRRQLGYDSRLRSRPSAGGSSASARRTWG